MNKKRKKRRCRFVLTKKIIVKIVGAIVLGVATGIGGFFLNIFINCFYKAPIKCVQYNVEALEKIEGNNTVESKGKEKGVMRKGMMITTVLENMIDKKIVIPSFHIAIDEIEKVEEPAPAIVGYLEDEKLKVFIINNGNGVLDESILEIYGICEREETEEQSSFMNTTELETILNEDEDKLKISLKSLESGEIRQVATFDVNKSIVESYMDKRWGWIQLYGNIKEKNSTKQITNIWIGNLRTFLGVLELSRSYEGDGIIERVIFMKVDDNIQKLEITPSFFVDSNEQEGIQIALLNDISCKMKFHLVFKPAGKKDINTEESEVTIIAPLYREDDDLYTTVTEWIKKYNITQYYYNSNKNIQKEIEYKPEIEYKQMKGEFAMYDSDKIEQESEEQNTEYIVEKGIDNSKDSNIEEGNVLQKEESHVDNFKQLIEGYYDYIEDDNQVYISIMQDDFGKTQIFLRYSLHNLMQEMNDEIEWSWEGEEIEYIVTSERSNKKYKITMKQQDNLIFMKIRDESTDYTLFDGILEKRSYLNETNVVIAMRKAYRENKLEKLDSSMKYMLPYNTKGVGRYMEAYVVPIYDANRGVNSDPVYYANVASEEYEDSGHAIIYRAKDWNEFVINGDNKLIPIQEFNLMDYIPRVEEKELTQKETIKIYKKYMRDNSMIGSYYAIIDVGKDKKPILVVADSNTFEGKVITPDMGYPIKLYTCIQDTVVELAEQIPQRMSSGPWYVYNNKLVSLVDNEGKPQCRIVEIDSQSYKNVYTSLDNQIMGKEWEIIKLTKLEK